MLPGLSANEPWIGGKVWRARVKIGLQKRKCHTYHPLENFFRCIAKYFQ